MQGCWGQKVFSEADAPLTRLPAQGCWGQKVFGGDEVPLTRLPCVRGAGPQSGPEGSFVDFRDKLSTLQSQFVHKNNPPVALRAPAPFTQGGLISSRHSFADPGNLLTPASCVKGDKGDCKSTKASKLIFMMVPENLTCRL